MDRGARALLIGPLVGHLGFRGLDGRPRVVPIWFRYRDGEVVMAAPPDDYKSRALRAAPDAVLTVSTPAVPYHVVSVHGRVVVELLPEAERIALVGELAARHLGPEAAAAYMARWERGGSPGPGQRLRLVIDRVRYTDLSG